MSNPTVGKGVAFPSREADSFPYRKIGDYLSFLTALTMSSKSGQSPVSSLERSSLPLARISKAPPLEGISVSDLMRSPSSRILPAKLTAFGAEFQTTKYSIETSVVTDKLLSHNEVI